MTQSNVKAATGSSWSKLAPYAEHGWVRCLVLILFGIGVHIPSLTGELLWDDIPLVNDNPLIKSPALILEAFRHYLFPDAYTGHYRPIQTILKLGWANICWSYSNPLDTTKLHFVSSRMEARAAFRRYVAKNKRMLFVI